MHFTGDLLLLNLAYVSAYALRFENVSRITNGDYFSLLLFFNLLWILGAIAGRIYEITRITRIEQVIWSLLKVVLLHVLCIGALVFIFEVHRFSRIHLVLTYVIFTITVFGWRILALLVLKKLRKVGFNYRKVVIVGAGPVGKQIKDFLMSNDSFGYKFLGFFDDNPQKHGNRQAVLGKVADVKQYALENNVSEIFCALPDHAKAKVNELLRFGTDHLIRIRIIPDVMRHFPKKFSVDFYGNIPVVLPRREPLESLTNRILKRTFDVVFSSAVCILVLLWLFPIIAIAIKLTSRGPIFFKQRRSGRDNNVFWCYKFRTMEVNEEADKKQATKQDERITPIGTFLRKTNLDELPQFFNVLAGDMSVVGPRPLMLAHTKEYARFIDKYMIRHLVKPGITGLSQVKGYRGITQDPELKRIRQQQVAYDVWYIEHWSLLLDIKIILMSIMTVWYMIRGKDNTV